MAPEDFQQNNEHGGYPIMIALPTIRERLANWIRDFLGINRYTIAWDFDHNGVRLAGRYDARYTTNGMSKRFAKRMVSTMNRAYDTTGHWVVPFSGRTALESDNG